ncbi:MAG TPA: hypothetical protein VFO16_01505 [Pseudonocardiaceae bacterium]|nr:hypothetical protein [Pseudonocardiaceae bacterium]
MDQTDPNRPDQVATPTDQKDDVAGFELIAEQGDGAKSDVDVPPDDLPDDLDDDLDDDEPDPESEPEPDEDEHAGPAVEHLASEGDRSLRRAADYARSRKIPLRVRVVLHLYTGKNYEGWRGQIWKVDTKGRLEAIRVKDALELFFESLATKGSDRLLDEMRELAAR